MEVAMRKLLIIALLAAAVSLQAQDFTVYTVDGSNNIVDLVDVDTITNTATDNSSTVLLRLPDLRAWGVSCQINAANISGTTDIDVSYQASHDGTVWWTVDTDSIAAGNYTELYDNLTGWPGRYFRVSGTGVGTHSSTWDVNAYFFKLPE